MKTSTMGPYWKVIGYGSIVGIAVAVGALMVFYLTFANEFGWVNVADALKWGLVIGLLTSGMVVVGTVAVARTLDTAVGKGLFILLSLISPLVGWLLFGLVNGVLVSWDFFFGFPGIAAVAAAASVIIAAIATLFMPAAQADTGGRRHPIEDASVSELLEVEDRGR